MKKIYKIFFVILILFYPIYKGVRELIWVEHKNYLIENTLLIKLRIDTEFLGFQDFNNKKTIKITNNKTKASLNISYVSLESDLYFFIDSLNSKKIILIADKFAGQNSYDYTTLELLSTKNCLKEFGGCSGFDDISFKKLGTPYLKYENGSFIASTEQVTK